MTEPEPYPWYLYRSDRELYDQWRYYPAREKALAKWSAQEVGELSHLAGALSMQSPAFLAHNFMSIRTKESGLVGFDQWTPAQRKLYLAYMETFRTGKQVPARFIILKARQMGISTLCEFLVFWRCYFFPFSKGLIATHEEDASLNLFAMLKLYYECIPGAVDTEWHWPTTTNNSERIVWDRVDVPMDMRIGSTVEIKTVGLGGTSRANSGKGRSQTPHILHWSEVAFSQEPERFWNGVAQGVAKKPGTCVFLESTANGMGGFFHGFWKRSASGWDVAYDEEKGIVWHKVANTARGSFVPLFFSWLEHPDYQAPIDVKPHEFRRSLTKIEKSLVEHYGATYEQIQWRRLTIADECGDDLQLFNQEYPALPEDAFMSSGRRVFDQAALTRQEERILTEPEPRRGDYDLEPAGEGVWVPKWRDDEYGPIRIWADPIPGAEYVLGADACYGKSDGDFACIQVLKKDNSEQVAQAHGRLDSDQLGVLCVALGLIYNEAKAVIEIDGPGLHALRVVQDLEYWNLYLRLAFDGVSKKPKRVYGWKMSTQSRRLMVMSLKAALREDEIILHDIETVREMREWMLTATTHGQAKEMPADPHHGYDDRITSLGEAFVGGIIQDGVGGVLASLGRPSAQQESKEIPVHARWPDFNKFDEGDHGVLGTMW